MVWSGGTYKKGNFTTNGWTGDASLGIGIEAGRHDTQDDDFATGINQCLNKDGSNVVTGNLNLNTNKLTNIGAGTARTDAAQVGQVQDGTLHWGSTSGGTANAQTLTLSPTVTAYVAGQRFSFLAGFTNTAAATLNVNGAGAKNIFNAATGVAIGAGEVVSGRAYEVIYDGTQFLLLNDVTPIQNGDYIWLGTTGGTATAQTATATPAITAYKAGQKFRMLTGFASTGSVTTQHTLNINGIGTKDITNQDNTNLTAGSFVAGAILEVVYDGTRLKMINDAGGWQAFNPTLSGSGAMTISAQTNAIAEYRKVGKTVTVVWDITFTTTGVAAQLVNSTAPVNSVYGLTSSGQVLFGNPMVSSGATGTIGQMYFTTATNIAIYRDTQSAPANFSIGGNALRVITTYRSV